MKILITGYYDRNNYGDDMYQSSFPQVFPKDNIIFVDINKLNQYTKEILEKEKFNLVVLGGGDVLTHYFLDIFNKWYYDNQERLKEKSAKRLDENRDEVNRKRRESRSKDKSYLQRQRKRRADKKSGSV